MIRKIANINKELSYYSNSLNDNNDYIIGELMSKIDEIIDRVNEIIDILNETNKIN